MWNSCNYKQNIRPQIRPNTDYLNHDKSTANISSDVGRIVLGQFEKRPQKVIDVLGNNARARVDELVNAIHRLRTNTRIVVPSVTKKSLNKKIKDRRFDSHWNKMYVPARNLLRNRNR